MNQHFNLYYLHWWTLTHFIFESSKYGDAGMALLQHGGTLDAFEKDIGSVDSISAGWFGHVRRIKAALASHDSEFLTSGQLPAGE